MSLMKKLKLLVVLMALEATSAWGHCTRGPAPTYQLDMAMGRLVVNPDLPVGSVIAQQRWTIRSGTQVNYSCTGKNVFEASIVSPGITDLGNKVYSTNVPGIGIRFSRGGSKVNIIYPGSYTTGDNIFTLEGSYFSLEVIKTAAVTGSGNLASGKYTSYDWDKGNNPILETSLSENSIIIVSPSCTIMGGKNMNVNVGTIKRSDLKGVGTTAGGNHFNIQLQCSGGLSESGYANIQTSFSGTLATGTTNSRGALLNEKSGSSQAKGIGIQVLKDGVPLEFNKKYSIGSLHSQGTSYITLPLYARFYQYAKTTSTGEVESHMTFNLTYD